MRCYEKNPAWAGCKTSCTVGVDKSDPLDDETPWSCTKIGRGRQNGPSLYCFSVLMTDTYELELVRRQAGASAGIFDCEEFTVFSDKKTWIVQGMVDTQVIPTKISVAKGKSWMMTHSWVNAEVFQRVWGWVCDHERYLEHDWTVKLDPDAVFLPERLKRHLGTEIPGPKYMRNCDRNEPPGFGMYGAIEVLSAKAVHLLAHQGLANCTREMNWNGKEMGWHGWGEDFFLQKCLDRLKVESSEDLGLLKDKNCLVEPSPCTTGQVVFHPFKTPTTYFQCLSQARR